MGSFSCTTKNIDKDTSQQKAYYDKSYKYAYLREGDLVLNQVVKPVNDYKIADKYENDP